MHNFPRNADAYIAMLRDIQYHTDFVTATNKVDGDMFSYFGLFCEKFSNQSSIE